MRNIRNSKIWVGGSVITDFILVSCLKQDLSIPGALGVWIHISKLQYVRLRIVIIVVVLQYRDLRRRLLNLTQFCINCIHSTGKTDMILKSLDDDKLCETFCCHQTFSCIWIIPCCFKRRVSFFLSYLKENNRNLSGSKKINYFELPQRPWKILNNNLNHFLAVSHQSQHQIFLPPRQYVTLAKKYIFSILHSFQEHKPW